MKRFTRDFTDTRKIDDQIDKVLIKVRELIDVLDSLPLDGEASDIIDDVFGEKFYYTLKDGLYDISHRRDSIRRNRGHE